MKTLEELREFYETTLVEDLRVLEEQRKKLVNKFLIVVVVILGCVGVGFAVMSSSGGSPVMIIVPLVLGLIVGGIIMSVMSKGYVQDFKGKIISKMVGFVDESLGYTQQACIPEATYMSSQIFRRRPDRYKGDDLVSGKVGATRIEFSEIKSEYKTTSTDSKGRSQTHWHTIFKGLFFTADFNKHFKGETVVLPDTAERLFGLLGQKLQSLNTFRGKLVKLEDPEFEKLFVVYGDDQIEARYILSMSLMERITQFKKKTKRPIYLSFVGSRVFVAVSYTKNLFEPRMFSTLLDFAPIREYFEDLQLAVGIVEDLNLNTRIWTKV
jgi:hypothetical protein